MRRLLRLPGHRPASSADAEDLRRLFDLSPQIPWLADAEGRIIRYHDRWRDMLGVSDDEARRAWATCGHPDDFAALSAAWAQSLATGAAFDREHRVRLADGGYRWFRSRAFPHRDAEGAIDGWYGVSEDIDELTRVRAELEDSRSRLADHEERLRLAMAGARLGAFDWDLTTGKGWWSARACEIAGFVSGQSVTREQHARLIAPEDRERVSAEIVAILKTGRDFTLEHRIMRPSGEIRLVTERGVVHRDATGRAVRMVGITQDVTEERTTAAALEASEQRLELAMTAARLGAWEWNLTAGRGWWSNRVCEIMGVPPGTEPTPELRWGLVHPDDRDEVRASAAQAAAVQGGYEQRYRIVRPDGEVRWVLSRGRANIEAGGPLTVSGVIQDVTDEEATRRALADSETRLQRSQAIAGIGSYEWNLRTGEGEFSPNLLRLAGLDPAARPTLPELIARVHPDDRAAVTAAAAAAAAGAPHADIEYRFVRPDGSIRWARDVGATTNNSQGVPFWAGVIIDITAMREATDRLAQTDERTRLIHAFAGVGTWEFVTREGMRWSNEIYPLYDRDPALGAPSSDEWAAMLHPDDIAAAMFPLTQAEAGADDFVAEFRVRRADGGWRWLQGRGRIERDAAGAVVRVLGINIDISERKAAEDALRQRERQLHAFVEQAPVGIAMFDRDMRYLAASERFLADLGRSRDEVLGRVHYDVIPDLPGHWREVHRRALAGESARAEADRFEHADGRIDWVDWEVRPWSAPDGSIGGIVLFAEYVTARVEAQRRLADSERLLRTIGDASLDLIFAKDLDGRLIYANAATAAVIGLPVADVIGRREIDWATDTAEAEAIMANDRRIMAGGRPDVAEELFTSPDGKRRVWRSTKVPFRDETGAVVGLAGVSTDITELRAREEDLQRINAELQAILQTVPAAIWITRDSEALVIDGNRMSREVLRIPEPDANMSKSAIDAPVAHFEVFDVAGRPIPVDDLPVQRAARGERVRDWRETIRFDDGEEISLIGNAEPLYDDDGAPRGAIAAFVDISALERAERALVEINASLEARIASATAEREAALAQLHEMQKLETLGQLTGGVAHDFNNLLTPIIGSLDLLRRRHGDDAREARLIDGALAAADRARVLVSRLLAFGRRQLLQPRAVDIAALVGDATEIITRTIGPQVPVRVSVPAGLPAARADPNQLELALLNLAVNARDAMPGGGQLTIAADAMTLDIAEPDLAPGSYIRLSVADTGIGMPEEVRRRAIEPFYTTKGVGKGTGLGLSMVHGFIAQLGGALRLHSAPGQGTRVEMWLPRAAAGDGAAPPDLAAPAPAARRDATLLLVDDDDLVRSGTAAMLGDLGYRVLESSSGAAALDILRQDVRIDALVTDFLMAGMTGGDLLAAARRARPGLPALVVTGFADTASLDLAAPVLAKPYGAGELAAAVAALFEPAAA